MRQLHNALLDWHVELDRVVKVQEVRADLVVEVWVSHVLRPMLRKHERLLSHSVRLLLHGCCKSLRNVLRRPRLTERTEDELRVSAPPQKVRLLVFLALHCGRDALWWVGRAGGGGGG